MVLNTCQVQRGSTQTLPCRVTPLCSSGRCCSDESLSLRSSSSGIQQRSRTAGSP